MVSCSFVLSNLPSAINCVIEYYFSFIRASNTVNMAANNNNDEVLNQVFLHHSFRRPDGTQVDKIYPFDPKRVVPSGPKKQRFGNTKVDCKYHLVDPEEGIDDKITIKLQTPPMSIPAGVKEWFDEKDPTKEPNVTTGLSFNGKEYDDDLLEFWDALVGWDEETVKTAIENKDIWWEGGEDYEESIVKFMYNYMTKSKKPKRDSNGNVYAPMLNVKLPKYKKVIKTKVYDDSNPPQEVPIESLKKGMKVRVLMKHVGLSITSKGFRHKFEALQIQIVDDSGAYDDDSGCAFIPAGETSATKKPKIEEPPVENVVDDGDDTEPLAEE